MNVQSLFKTTSSIEQIKDISCLLIQTQEKIQSLSEGKVDYFNSLLEARPEMGVKESENIFETMEAIQGFESESYRHLHNAFLYIENLGKI